MSSQLNVDTIVDKAGSGGSNVKMANTSTYVSDGGAVTQNTVQGLCKSWFNFDGKSTVSIRDSFNVASMTDRGTGLYTQTFTAAMGNANFTGTGSSQASAGDVDGRNRMIVSEPNSTAAAVVNSFDTSGNADDDGYNTSMIFGDLA